MSRLAGTPISSSVSGRILNSRAATSRAGPYEALEDEVERRRRAVAAETAPKLMVELVRTLNAPLARLLEVQRANRGGAPGLYYRSYVIDKLVPFFRQVYGKEPTATPKGEFVLLCELILTAIGLDVTGLEGAVERRLAAGKR